MIPRTLLGTLLLCAWGQAAPASTGRMTVSKMRVSDLETSATGYVYNQQQGHPVSYMLYTDHGSGRYYDAPDTALYVAAPVAHAVTATALRHRPAALAELPYDSVLRSHANGEIDNYAGEQLPEYAPRFEPVKPRAPYYEAGENDGAGAEEVGGKSDEKDDEKEDADDGGEDVEDEHVDDGEDDGYGYFDDREKDFDFDGENYKDVAGFDLEFPKEFYGKRDEYHGGEVSASEAGDGVAFAEAQHSASGEKGAKGYENDGRFSEAEHANHDEEKLQGYYDVEGGEKKDNTDTSGSYGQAEEKEKHAKDGSYGKSTYHKKGEKTNGFHNVYRKDEYKKNTDFYDDDHKEGHFDKHEEFDGYHKEAEGAFEKGGQHSSGFDHKDNGKKGYYDKGHDDNYSQGHKDEEGEKSYHKHRADYATKKNSKSDKSHKYSKESGAH